tara:strand:+ start:344 stop:610 length:267 start_codon:yes stop_codon:yes gene_type:complete
MSKEQTDKPMVSFNDKGFVLNYSVTRNEEIAFIDYETESITFKQMAIPVDRIKEMLEYYKNTRKDHGKYVNNLNKELSNENSNSKGNK